MQPPEAIATTWLSGRERQRLEVDLGVFPDLGVDEAAEEPLEQPLQKPLAGQRAMAADRLLQADIDSRPADRPTQQLRLEPILHNIPRVGASLMTGST